MAIPRVRPARDSDRNALAQMRALLWPDAQLEHHRSELDDLLSKGKNGTQPMALLVAEDDNGGLIGFLEVGLRSHADGCDPARPVGFGRLVRSRGVSQSRGRQRIDAFGRGLVPGPRLP